MCKEITSEPLDKTAIVTLLLFIVFNILRETAMIPIKLNPPKLTGKNQW